MDQRDVAAELQQRGACPSWTEKTASRAPIPEPTVMAQIGQFGPHGRRYPVNDNTTRQHQHDDAKPNQCEFPAAVCTTRS